MKRLVARLGRAMKTTFPLIALLVPLWFACGGGNQDRFCTPNSCTGCCTADDRCITGDTAAACGAYGQQCAVCSGGASCVMNVCLYVPPARADAGAVDAGSDAGEELPDAGEEDAGFDGGNGEPATTLLMQTSGAGQGALHWKAGTASGTCQPNCTDTGAPGRWFEVTVTHDEFSGFDGLVGCGSDGLACKGYLDSDLVVSGTFIAHPATPSPSQLKVFAGAGSSKALRVEPAAAGGFYMAGSVSGAIDLGGGALSSEPPLLARFDANGGHLWSKRFTGSNATELHAFAIAPDGTLAVGGYCNAATRFSAAGAQLGTSGPCVARFDANGNLPWAKGWAGSATVRGIAVGPNGDIAITGNISTGSVNFGTGTLTQTGYGDFFLGVLDAAGTARWAKRGGSSAHTDTGYSAAFDPAGDVLFSGTHSYKGTLDGLTFNNANFNHAGWIARYTVLGTYVDGRAFTTSGNTDPMRIRVTAAGDIFLAGEIAGDTNFGGGLMGSGSSITGNVFVVKYDSALNFVWANLAYGDFADLAVAPDGSAFVSARFYRYADFGRGYLLGETFNRSAALVKLASTGDWLWSKRIASGAMGYGVAVLGQNVFAFGNGTPIVAGSTGSAGLYWVGYPR